MVQLGFRGEALLGKQCDAVDLPNKMGGLAIWLNPELPLRHECCSKPMSLLLQLYAPEEYDYAYHRIIYVYCCMECHSFKVFRSQLHQENDIYDDQGMLKDEYKHMCRVCGVKAGKKCSKCKEPYCSQECQLLDWKEGHEQNCGSDKRFKRLFPEFEIESEAEPDKSQLTKNINTQPTDSLDWEPENEEETTVDVDKAFLKFEKRVALDQDQIIRYARLEDESGPLFVSDLGKPSLEQIGRCPHCSAPRTFEFQIMPQMLNHLNIDHRDLNALDWGTILIYTCDASCDTAVTQYVEEFAWMQPFSKAGLGDSIREKLRNKEE